MRKPFEPSETMKAGYAFCDALRRAAEQSCETRDIHAVFYYMKRMREVEGTVRTIERMEQR